jgi:hypothetical protein
LVVDGALFKWRQRQREEGLNQRNAAGEVLTAKQASHRPVTAPALGLRADTEFFDIEGSESRPDRSGSKNSLFRNLSRR